MKSQNLSLLVITSYPQKGSTHGVGTVGVASYAKNTLLSLIKAVQTAGLKPKILVLAEKTKNQEKKFYDEDEIRVRRVWQRDNFFSYFLLIGEILHQPKIKKILIEFELAMFGSFLSLVGFPLFLLILKLLGKEVILVSHQVVVDINELSTHAGIRKNSFKAQMINKLIKLFYQMISPLVAKIIVFEDYLKERLAKFVDPKKIVVIPHGVERINHKITKIKARKILGLRGEFVILCFGFIAWYKGTDWLINEIKKQKTKDKSKKIKLIIAGGANPNHKNKSFYMNYVHNLEKKAKHSNGKIMITGFVKETDIPLYFSACDLVVLPYRVFMSSSGPLSLAFSFKKAFLLSEKLGNLLKTKDLKTICQNLKISRSDLSFKLNSQSFKKVLENLLKNKRKLEKLEAFSHAASQRRYFAKIGKLYLKEIYA